MSKKKQDPAKEPATQQPSQADEKQEGSDNKVLHPTNPENEIHEDVFDESLHSTGKVAVDTPFIDNQVLSRLRTSLLSPSEIYHEAQLISAQTLDIASLLKSNEIVLVQNLIEILRTANIYHPAAFQALLTDDSKTQEVVGRYIVHCLKHDLTTPVMLAEELASTASSDSIRDKLSHFIDKFCTALLALISQPQQDLSGLQFALSRTCDVMEKHAVSRLLYDPSPVVRVAVIRSIQNRPAIEMNDLSVALILLKDHDDSVNIALMRMLARFSTFPELVIPQVLATLADASDALRNEILDLFRSYANDAVDPVILSLDTTQNSIYRAACQVIAQCPPRFTDALLKQLCGVRTTDHARQRVIDILKSHKDAPRREEIMRALKPYLDPRDEELPEWTPPETCEKFLKPATSNESIYENLLSDKEIAKIAKTFDDEVLGKLLSDASETVQINALHIIRHLKKVSPANLQIIQVWLKSTSPTLASEALNVILTLENSDDAVVATIIEAFSHNESAEVKKLFFDVMLQHQSSINAMIRAYYTTPKRCSGFVMKFLALGPNPETLKQILAGLDRNQTVACIAETMNCLLTIKCEFDNKKIRSLLMSHVREPISFGQHGFMTRLLGLKLLRKYMMEDESRDAETISALQAFYKDGKNAELRQKTKNLLKDLGEEIFDFDDEDDDFEDLNDEEDDE